VGFSALVLAMVFALQTEPTDTLVVRADNLATGRAELRVVEELRLGSLDGPEESSFGYVDAIAVAPDGTLYVADVQVPAVRVFDPAGTYLGDLGRKGEGPGEYIAIRGITALLDGAVAIWHEMGDVSVFDRDRQFIRRFSVKFMSIAGGVGPGVVADTAGNLFIRTTAARALWSAPQVIRYAWVRYSISGEFLDSIVAPDRRLEGSPFAFRSETVFAPSPHGYFVTGRTTEYAIHRPLRDGRVIRIERDYDPISIKDEERSQWERYVGEVESRRGEDFPGIHSTKPAWKDLRLAADGRIWVQRYSSAEHVPGHESRASVVGGFPTIEWVEPLRYDVLDPRGSYLGSVVLPTEADFLFAREQFVWTLERGEYDEPYVVRYRVDGLPGAE